MCAAALVLAVLLAGAPAAATDWPMYGPGGACPGGAGTGACLKPLHNPPIGETVWPSLPQPIATGLNFPTSVTICTGRDCPTPP